MNGNTANTSSIPDDLVQGAMGDNGWLCHRIAELEQSLAEHQSRLSVAEALLALYPLGQELAAADDEAEVVRVLARPAREAGAVGAACCSLEVNETGDPVEAEVVATWNRAGRVCLPLKTRFSLPDFPHPHPWVSSQHEPVVIADITKSEQLGEPIRRSLIQSGLSAHVVLPLRQASQWVGFLVFFWETPRAFPDHEVAVYRALIGLAAPTIQTHRLLQSFEQGIAERSTELEATYYQLQQQEAALRERLYHMQRTLDLTTDIIYIFDVVEQRYVYANREIVRALGYTAGALQRMGTDVVDILIHPDDRRVIDSRRRSLTCAGDHDVIAYESRTRHANGAWRWFATFERVFKRAPDGTVRHVIGASRDMTDTKQVEQMLRESEQRYRSMVESQHDCIVRFTAEGHCSFVNDAYCAILGTPYHELRGRPFGLHVHADDVPRLLETVARLETPPYRAYLEDRIHTRYGLRWFGWEYTAIKNAEGQTLEVQAVGRDITDRVNAEKWLREANEQLRLSVAELEQHNTDMTLLNEMSTALQTCATVEEAYLVAEPFASRLFADFAGALYLRDASRGLVEAVAVWGNPPPNIRVFAPDECGALTEGRTYRVGASGPDQRCTHMEDSGPSSYVCVPLMAQNEILGTLTVFGDPPDPRRSLDRRGKLVVMVAGHLALSLANLQLREQFRNQSIRDPLTELFNRRYLDETLEREIQRALRYQSTVGVIMLDIDHFKRFNDTYGHDVGDALLHEMGSFLRECTRSQDIACRYGGEEFTLILPDASLQGTHRRAEQVCEDIRRMQVDHQGVSLGMITISLGVACFPEHGTTRESLIRAADRALLAAKAAGRNRVVVADAAP